LNILGRFSQKVGIKKMETPGTLASVGKEVSSITPRKSETEILSSFWKRKKGNILFPDWPIKVWLFFKKYIVEDTKVRTQITEAKIEKRKEFRDFIDPIIIKYGPRSIRGSTPRCRQYRTEFVTICWKYFNLLFHEDLYYQVGESETGGVGLFWTRSDEIPIKANGGLGTLETIVGFLIYLTEDDFEFLRKGGYPSLFGQNYLMIGPLSLVNHNCKSPFAFTDSKRNYSNEEFEGLLMVQLKVIEFTEGDYLKSKAGQEIFAKYSNEKPIWCTCDL
jgi:hypothetical protein